MTSGIIPALRSSLRVSSERRGFGWAILSPAATLGAAILTNAIASRVLGIAGLGSYLIATAVASLLGIAVGLGMPATLVRYTAGVTSASERVALYRLGWKAALLSAVVLGALFLVCDTFFPGVARQWLPPGAAIYVVAAAVGSMLVELAAAERQTSLHFFGFFLVNAGLSVARVIGVIGGFLALGPSVLSGVIGYGIGSLVAGVGLATLTMYYRPSAPPQPARPDELRKLLVFGLPIMGSAYIIAAIGYLDLVIVAKAMAREQLGLYGAGARLTVIQNTLIAGVTTLALPMAARSVAAGDVNAFISRALRRGLTIGIALTVILVLVSPLVVRIVYGPGYEVSAAVYTILAVGFTLNFPGNPLSQLLYAAGRPRFMLGVHVLQLLLLLLLLPYVARHGGALTVASTWSAVNLIAVGTIIAGALALRRTLSAPR